MIIFTVETVVTIFIMVVLVLIYSYGAAKKYIKQRRCIHVTYYETRSCDAVCKKCSKNLGFIGTLRDERAKLKEEADVKSS